MTDLKSETAESAYFAEHFDEAADLFYEINDIRRALDCYKKANNWDKIIKLLNLHKKEFSMEERMAFLNKFFPNFL